MCPNAPRGRCRRHVLPRPSSRARRVPHLPWTNTPVPCRCNRHIGNAFHLTALTNIANSPWHGELLSARAGADKTTRCALTAAVHRRSGGEVLLLAYRGRPNGHLISGQVGVNGAMIESPGCALRTDSKGSMSRTAASDQPSVFIVPFSPTSGHRTLKPAGLIHRKYARVTWHIANESPWREREAAGHKPHTMRARPCLPVINGARHERGHVVLIESDEPHGHRPVVCED